MRCGRHALNNVMGSAFFDDEDLTIACNNIIAETDDPPQLHARANGWYSHSALGKALEQTNYVRMLSRWVRDVPTIIDHPQCWGIVVNVNNAHWVAMVKHNGRKWWVDSMSQPQEISHAAYLEKLASPNLIPFAVVDDDFADPLFDA